MYIFGHTAAVCHVLTETETEHEWLGSIISRQRKDTKTLNKYRH